MSVGEDFTIELQFSKSAGYTKQSMIELIAACLETDPETPPTYIYERESKILERYIFEITGVKRDLTPRPVISQDLLERLQYLIATREFPDCIVVDD